MGWRHALLALAAALAFPALAYAEPSLGSSDRMAVNPDAPISFIGTKFAGITGSKKAPGGGPAAGTPTSAVVPSPDFASSTDLAPVSQFVNGSTIGLVLKSVAPTGLTSSYNVGSYTAPNFSFTDSSPGYDSSGSVISVNRPLLATSWLRQTYNNAALPTEAANGGNARISLTLNDFVYSGDGLSGGSAAAGLYTGSLSKSGIAITNSSTRAYPRPICAWVTPPGERVGTSGSLTVEMFCGHAYAQGGVPVAAVVFTLSDGTHTVSHTVSALTASAKQFSTSCTATNGSAQLTACGSTAGLQVGERMNVPGIPGQPKILSLTASAITFGQTTTCTPTLLGSETISTTPGAGEALGDGAFAGATISDANLTGSPVAIVVPVGTGSTVGSSVTLTVGAPATGQWSVGQFVTGTNIPAGDYISALGTSTGGAGTVTLHTASTGTVSGNVTGSYIGANPGGTTVTTVHISTAATIGVALAGPCTINHIYQGVTGSVTATLGNPVPVYSATFSAGDFTNVSQGAISIRALVYPNIGNAPLDTQTGADGTNCDWFYNYDAGTGGAGVCDSGNAAYFATTGLNVSPNLHNLWAYYDKDNSYSPLYCFVGASGAATTVAAACNTTGTAPASGCTTTCFPSIGAATQLAAIKAYNNNGSNRATVHNDLNGLVSCYLAGTYLGFGGVISTSITAGKPGIIATSVADSGACPPTGSAGANLSGVTFGHAATATNMNAGTAARLNNITISDTSDVFVGSDTTNHTTFLTSEFIFNNDKFLAGAASPLLFSIGVSDIYNSLSDESAHNGSVFSPSGVNTNTNHSFFNTEVGGSFVAQVSSQILFVSLGNMGWGIQPNLPASNAIAVSNPQATSVVMGFNRYMGQFAVALPGNSPASPQQNFLDADNIFECLNRTGQNPCVQISADTVNVPLANFVRQYSVVAGARTNLDYLEGIPLGVAAGINTGGSLVAGTTYFEQTGYALKGNPTVETSTDGPTAGAALPSPCVVSSIACSYTVVLPCDPNYVFYVYLNTTNPPTHSATVGGADAKQLAGCQTVTVTAIGGARTPPTVAGTTGHNEFKTAVFQRFSIDNNFNMKNDTYNGSGATASGGRVGNWEARWRTGWIGNVSVTGTQINSGSNPTSGLGEIAAYLDSSNPANSNTDLSWVLYQSDRSFGGFATDPVAPALNIGEGDYCPANSTHVGSRVPAGFAAYPWGVDGGARKNDGTGYAGAYEGGCQ